jgi:hypothetical protein
MGQISTIEPLGSCDAARAPAPAPARAEPAGATPAEILFVPYSVNSPARLGWRYRAYDALTRPFSPRFTRCVVRVDGRIYMMTRDGWRVFDAGLYDGHAVQSTPVSSPEIDRLARTPARWAITHARLTVRQCLLAILLPARFDHCSSAVGRLVGRPSRSPDGLYRWMRRRGHSFEIAPTAGPTAGSPASRRTGSPPRP